METAIHITMVMEATEVAKLKELDSRGMILYVRYLDHKLQAIVVAPALSDDIIPTLTAKKRYTNSERIALMHLAERPHNVFLH